MKMRQCIATSKFLLVITAVMIAFVVNVSAENTGNEVEQEETFEPLVDFTDPAQTIDYARVRRCCVTSGSIRVQTRDLFIAGDIWRAVVHEGGVSDVTSNTSGKGPGAPALAPGVFGNIATIARRCAWVVTTLGNTAPGGLPADGQTRVTSSTGGGVSCVTESTHP